MATSVEKDQLAQEYRNRVALNLSNLSTSISKAGDTYDVGRKIPGVSQETIQEFHTVIEDAKTFFKTADTETADAIASKRDFLELKMQQFVDKMQLEVKEVKVQEEVKEEEKKDTSDNSFNLTRFTGNLTQTAFNILFWSTLIVLALWGGSIASNHAIDKSFAIRLFYFIFGTLLFPISFAFALMRWIVGGFQGKYYAILAPLIPLPTVWWKHVFLFLFTYKSPLQPQPVSFVATPVAVPESQVV